MIQNTVPEVNVNLFDTRGLDLGLDEKEVSRKSIISEIEKRSSSSNIENHMHIMWYCLSKKAEESKVLKYV